MTAEQAAMVVALGGAVKDKALNEAKAALAEGSAHSVDFTARIRGSVIKGHRTPGSSYSHPASCNMMTPSVVGELLRRLKVDPAKVRRQLRAIGKSIVDGKFDEDHEDSVTILEVFGQVAAETAAKLPERLATSSGRAAPVRSDVQFEVLRSAAA